MARKTNSTKPALKTETYRTASSTKIGLVKLPKPTQPRKNTIAVVGIALGDEGKGRLVDNRIETLLKTRGGVKNVYVVRFQGGNNAGHTVIKDSIKLALHLVPSGVFYEKAVGVMDRGMFIHVEDLQTELSYVEKAVGTLKKRLWLSDEAILCTDLERAEEVLNREKTGRAKGGTGRGVAPSYAHNLDRLGLKIFDLLDDNWKHIFTDYYDRYQKEFAAYDLEIGQMIVPDFYNTYKSKKEQNRVVGSKKEYLQRLLAARSWLLARKMVTNTFKIHKEIASEASTGILFEGAQAAGLDAWLGTRPDITASNTRASGVAEGTAFWKVENIEKIIGVFKITYTSSVGARKMPTHIDLPKDLADLKNPTPDQQWGAYIRETAHEYGTTTGRPRDITHLDLAFLKYNANMSGVDMLEGTHLDIAKADQPIKVCTHYTDKRGQIVPYQPGLRYQEGVVPQYVELPGWDGSLCSKAKKQEDLPKNAIKFLAFIQKELGFPIVGATTGSLRDNIVRFAGY